MADRGIGVAFHFHPMVYYDSWRVDYGSLATAVTEGFLPKDVLFLSMGSVTFIKPVMKAIRRRGRDTKMLQMELVRGPKGKLSYPADLKREMFGHMYRAFEPWHGRVFMYLCMEEAAFWHSTFGCCYDSNEEFEADFGDSVREKLEGLRRGWPSAAAAPYGLQEDESAPEETGENEKVSRLLERPSRTLSR